MDEVQRIKDAYSKRIDQASSAYSYLFSQQRERGIKDAILREGVTCIVDKKILDVGCGSGAILGYFLKEGSLPKNLFGIDLLPDRIEKAKKLYPGISFICKNAEGLPCSDEFFDAITQSTVFTSILDYKMKKRIASEMVRVLKPTGIIIWHDYRFNNPFNPNVKGIGKREIEDLFPNCQFDFKLINLNPLIARPLVRFSWRLCEVLEKIPVLLSHWLVTIKKSNLKPD